MSHRLSRVLVLVRQHALVVWRVYQRFQVWKHPNVYGGDLTVRLRLTI